MAVSNQLGALSTSEEFHISTYSRIPKEELAKVERIVGVHFANFLVREAYRKHTESSMLYSVVESGCSRMMCDWIYLESRDSAGKSA